MKNPELKYGNYIKEMCCDDCEYAGGYQKMGIAPPMPLVVCPECGGNLTNHVGRWMYSETPVSFWQAFITAGVATPETIYHKFVKGRECEPLSPPKNP